MSAQAYTPYRTTLISREELRNLNSLTPSIAMRDTILHWVLIVTSFAVVANFPNIPVIVAAVIFIGVNLYGLYIIGHDGLHRRLFSDARKNDFWNDVFVVGSFGAITRVNRSNHMDHHRVTCLETDPDRHKYTHDGKEPVLPFFVFLMGFSNLWPSVRNVFLGVPKDKAIERPQEERYNLRDIAILVGWQLALIAGLTYFVGWWAYPVLWVLPLYLFAYRGDLTRVFCEHSMHAEDDDADESMRMVTYTSNWLERAFFAPHNMNYHMAHHLWPGIPYYNLPEADRLIRRSEAVRQNDPNLVWRTSYLGYILSYVRWRLGEGRQVKTGMAA